MSSANSTLAPPSKHIVIIGGSLAGLFTATPLLRLGHRVTILERSPTPLLHDQGAGIVAGGETLAWFRRHDLFQREISVGSTTRLYLDREGGVVDREDWKQRMTSWDLVWNLSRANFNGEGGRGYIEGKDWARVEGSEEVKKQWERARYEYGREATGLQEKDEKVVVKWRSTREGAEEGLLEGSEEADVVIAADGPSSRLKGIMLGENKASKRTYAGYVAFRGTVRESELSAGSTEVFVEKFTFFHADGVQILAYTIPGHQGTLEKGKRLINWVWYWNELEENEAYVELMTDSEGARHRFTLPTGGKSQSSPFSTAQIGKAIVVTLLTKTVQPQVWKRQQQRAMDLLPPQFAELVTKTEKPFVQAITDVEPPQQGTPVGRLLHGKAGVVGDALAGFRPHTAASTSQAAFDALQLERVFAGDMSWEEYEADVLGFAQSWQRRGVMLGNRSQFGSHPLSQGHVDGPVSREQLHMRQRQQQQIVDEQ
ncbi:uncharacterized protein HMPREF1541_02044 [Cyphellophora europaea CBS 101466]|uniref:Uncharacterized protein n=1 Tax=Cyphellophora europaea (strain CBS 101466) TaxID=1220924 RepID=W2S2G7_CYPE1|nr:uncharacterized protein HMPREF1541_02044 [Cyphellophora europaea CBS 101466]ETN42886.1 hypothetical protein HMPREF1541_02044 [Cyphellophora europaea CBS 101466]